MKKTDVYVVVDTPKKAKKLKMVLDMFKESVYNETTLGLSTGFDSYGDSQFNYPHLFIDDYREWCGYYARPSDKTQVSIKELRNILAKEHLKSGDVVALGYGKSVEYIGVFKAFNNGYFEVERYSSLNSGSSILMNDSGYIKNFIRYATEEEKDLLEPKKELEVGKWYKSWNDSYNGYDLSYYTGTGTDYGFHAENNNWFEEQYWIKNSMTLEWQEATTQEIEQALIEEAKRRYKVGDVIKCFDKRDCELYGFVLKYDEMSNSLYATDNRNDVVFNNGQWATVIEQDNFTDSDIAIVERLHDILLDNHGYSLESELLTDARMLANKIKSNIK